jgi:microcystin-dependent protein
MQRITMPPVTGTIKPGMMMIWPTDTAPIGWLLSYGQAISRSVYASLFAVIGTTFGIGDGATTFNLPDFRGRVPLGQDDMGGASANRVTSAQADTIGGSAGAENHTLIIGELPAHNHMEDGVSGTASSGSGVSSCASKNAWTNNTGSDLPHNNMQPYLTLNYIIKT